MPVAAELLAPIAGDNPSGVYLRYDPVYDKIKEARRESDGGALAVEADAKRADFPLVIKLCIQELSKRTKDLDIAVFLTEALLRRDGYAGLRDGLELLHGLVDTFWDTVYPEIEDGDPGYRATPLNRLGTTFGDSVKHVPLTNNGLDWFIYKQSRTVGYEKDAVSDAKVQARQEGISEGKMTAEEFDEAFNATPRDFYQATADEIDACLQWIEKLDALCTEKFGDEAPGFAPLRESLQEVRGSVGSLLARKPVEEGEATEEAAAETGAGESSWSSAEAEPAAAAAKPVRRAAGKALAEEPADAEDAANRVIAIARWWRRQDSSSVVPFLLLRALRWGELRASTSLDTSLLEAPPTETRKQIAALAAESSSELLEAVESAMGTAAGRGWLDLQRYAANACEYNGNTAAATAIRSELKALLADYPDLQESVLNDETPTAGRETLKWLTEVASANGASAGVPPIPEPEAEARNESTPDVYQEAAQLAENGQPEQAIELLQAAASRERSGRDRFRRRLQLAQVCIEAGYDGVATPILAGLSAEIDQRKLEDWESAEWLAHAIALLYRCLRKEDGAGEQARKLYAQLCRLDPVQALTYAR